MVVGGGPIVRGARVHDGGEGHGRPPVPAQLGVLEVGLDEVVGVKGGVHLAQVGGVLRAGVGVGAKGHQLRALGRRSGGAGQDAQGKARGQGIGGRAAIGVGGGGDGHAGGAVYAGHQRGLSVQRAVGQAAQVDGRGLAGVGADRGILVAQLLGDPHLGVFFAEVVAEVHQLEGAVLVAADAGAQAAGRDVAVVDVVVGVAVVGGAVAPVREHGPADLQQRGDDGQVHGGGPAALAMVAAEQAGVAVGAVFRLVGNHIDHAGGGVAAVQGALRAAQHLDALGVVEVGLKEEAGGLVGAAEMHPRAAVGAGREGVVADAADHEVGAEVGAAEQGVGHLELNLAGAGDVARLQRVPVKGRDRDGGFFDGLLALFCGDDQLFDQGRALRPRHAPQHQGARGQCIDKRRS